MATRRGEAPFIQRQAIIPRDGSLAVPRSYIYISTYLKGRNENKTKRGLIKDEEKA
jgi:hypothetical protein